MKILFLEPFFFIFYTLNSYLIYSTKYAII